MAAATATAVVKQHLIDPESCIRCGTCEITCPSRAISQRANHFVVDAVTCTLCGECLEPCPTGAIDNWRAVPRTAAYSLETQAGWDELPAELTTAQLADAADVAAVEPPAAAVAPWRIAGRIGPRRHGDHSR